MALRWFALGLASIALALLLYVLHVPAALLLGSLIAAATMAIRYTACIVPGAIFRLAHGVVGLLIARSLAASTLNELLLDWPLFLAGTLLVVGASSLIGWAVARLRILPGTTAVWGAAPGAATAMVLMSASFGADTRLVAFMQYLRVICVVMVATIVGRVWIGESAAAGDAVSWFPPLRLEALLPTLLILVAGVKLGQALRIPAGPMLVPMVLGTILHNLGIMSIELPPWLLAPTYAVVGWQVGSRFDRPILLHALRALPGLLLATAALIGVCAGFAVLLVVMAGVDPLTAYLATSPGGIDSVAIIGLAGQADMAFVMAMQMARFLFVMLTGPWIAARIARSVARRSSRA